MRHKTSIPCAQDGFTLVEIIVTITLASILATLMVQYMGTAMTASSGPVNMVRDGAKMEALMEKIISDYVKEINSDPANALQSIWDTYNPNSNVSPKYITFTNGDENTPGGATNTLKITVQAAGHSITTLLTNSRAKSGDPVSNY
jgi:prepilin-type N-terminal cleavage/methylation domain-containing protein